jgi:hypothetical protein
MVPSRIELGVTPCTLRPVPGLPVDPEPDPAGPHTGAARLPKVDETGAALVPPVVVALEPPEAVVPFDREQAVAAVSRSPTVTAVAAAARR